MSEAKQNAYKFKLGSGKEVILREPKIRDQELALEVASNKGKNETMISVIAQKELLKNLLVSVNGKAIDAKEREQLDALFSFHEFMQLQMALKKVTGGDEMGNFETEIVQTSGGK